jgi:hypothetical protein
VIAASTPAIPYSKKEKVSKINGTAQKTITNIGLIAKHTKFRHKELKEHGSLPLLLPKLCLLGSLL